MTEPILTDNNTFNLEQNNQTRSNQANRNNQRPRQQYNNNNRNYNYSRNQNFDQNYYNQNNNYNNYYPNNDYNYYYHPEVSENNNNYYNSNTRRYGQNVDRASNQNPNTSNFSRPQNQRPRPNKKKESPQNSENLENPLNEAQKSNKAKIPKEKPKKLPQSQAQPKLDLSRSELLIQQLKKNKCECMVCYSVIRNDKPIWTCNCCYHIFHLSCIKKWASSPAAKITENSDQWRCPGCQTIFDSVPNKYKCFCGKKLNPEPENRPFYHLKLTPHSCNEICGKPLVTSDQIEGLQCKHKCLDICHPGPCSPCEALVNRTCNCGKSKFQVKCSSSKVPQCEQKCDKILNCKIHICDRVCHGGDCEPCDHDIEINCHSHGDTKTVKCGSDEANMAKISNNMFKCDKICDRLLSCKNHKCTEKCHDGECKPCMLMPSKLINCPCGQTQVKELLIKKKIIRTVCTDPVPTCDKTCSKILPCNSSLKNEVHLCENKCHMGECPACEKLVQVQCRCGKESDEVKCCDRNELKLCDRRCLKKKSCGKHQCQEICCNDKEHICMQICNKKLNCGIHKCEDLCHKGSCKRCLVASFEERVCDCSKTIQYPPIRCGTKPLDCPHPCSRTHSCEHPVTHNCHWETNCPPCSFLTSKMCMGNHEVRHNIPCYMKDVGCGKPCGKQLPNCSHKCVRTCHKGDCMDTEYKSCTQLCKKLRPHCDHSCNSACHGDTPCPDTVCQELIQAKCKCGLKSKQVKCMQKMYGGESSVVFENIASQLKEMLSCRSIDVSSFNKEEIMKKKHLLECDEECLLAERNKAIAQALQIEAQTRPKPIYNDFLKNYAREDPSLVFNIEYKFAALVQECKLYKTKKSVCLPVMKTNERRFVHELATYYGIETISEDPEPNRSVTLYGNKEKCFIPSVLLSQSIDLKLKQTSMPKIAIKQLNQKVLNPMESNMKSLMPESEPISLSSAFSALVDEKADPNEGITNEEKDKKVIDYFDFN
ncbi:unnamed protein product [Brachionus calyciflorus]|uniref:Uncharacterized protein n=1 Tax=Brachionus calyciflorus TaxID=104777 RepID=A0A813SZL9_9BILA|nr:unnamed protein product [Brachionus calyciflorus]